MKALAVLLLAGLGASGQTLQGHDLVEALQRGGYVILMRHANSPREAPSKENADAANVKRERQLDETGRATAAAMGEAFRRLKIPVGEVLSSPAYRALETIRLAQFGTASATPELGDNGQSMQAASDAQADWLRERVTELSKNGRNTLLVTHAPNISRAFPAESAGLADGEALVFGPGGKVVARVPIGEWSELK